MAFFILRSTDAIFYFLESYELSSLEDFLFYFVIRTNYKDSRFEMLTTIC